MLNPIGTKGQLANAFAAILHDMWQGDQTYLTPTSFRVRAQSSRALYGGLMSLTIYAAFHRTAWLAV
jgi:hypothetical protein